MIARDAIVLFNRREIIPSRRTIHRRSQSLQSITTRVLNHRHTRRRSRSLQSTTTLGPSRRPIHRPSQSLQSTTSQHRSRQRTPTRARSLRSITRHLRLHTRHSSHPLREQHLRRPIRLLSHHLIIREEVVPLRFPILALPSLALQALELTSLQNRTRTLVFRLMRAHLPRLVPRSSQARPLSCHQAMCRHTHPAALTSRLTRVSRQAFILRQAPGPVRSHRRR